MGLGKHHWRPPLTLGDLEFQNGRLVKVRGMRPMYMDGYALIAALEWMAELYHKATTRPQVTELPIVHPPPDILSETFYPLPENSDPGGDSSGS